MDLFSAMRRSVTRLAIYYSLWQRREINIAVTRCQSVGRVGLWLFSNRICKTTHSLIISKEGSISTLSILIAPSKDFLIQSLGKDWWRENVFTLIKLRRYCPWNFPRPSRFSSGNWNISNVKDGFPILSCLTLSGWQWGIKFNTTVFHPLSGIFFGTIYWGNIDQYCP